MTSQWLLIAILFAVIMAVIGVAIAAARRWGRYQSAAEHAEQDTQELSDAIRKTAEIDATIVREPLDNLRERVRKRAMRAGRVRVDPTPDPLRDDD